MNLNSDATMHEARELLRLHIEAGWGVRLPPLIAGGEHVCLPGGAVPEWAVYVAVVGEFGERPLGGNEERVRIRRDVDAGPDTLAPLWQAAEAALDAEAPSTGVTREVALHLAAPSKLDVTTARTLACPLGEQDRAAVEEFEPGESAYYLDAPRRAPVIGAFLDGRWRRSPIARGGQLSPTSWAWTPLSGRAAAVWDSR